MLEKKNEHFWKAVYKSIHDKEIEKCFKKKGNVV